MRFLAALLLALFPIQAVPASSTATGGKTGPAAVGALFSLAPDGTLGSHFCTGSVVHSPSGELVLTAAHCLAGRAPDSIAFVPQYDHGRAPFGIWRVQEAFVDQPWQSSADADHDLAFLRVAPRGTTTLESQTGAERLGAGTSAGKQATVVGYPASSESAISCSNALHAFSPTQLEFDCGGYTNGTSGSPLVVDSDPATGLGTVVGVIGGYEEGGETADVSYAAAFSAGTNALYRLAAAA